MIICFFFFQFIYMMDYIDRFSYVEPALHLWDEAYLIIMDNFSNVFLDLVCQYFIENFCIDVHEWDWSVILFFGWVFVQFWYQGNRSLLKRVWQWAFCFYYMEHFEEYRYWLFLKVLVEFCTKTTGPLLLLVWKFLLTASIPLRLIVLFKLLTWSWFNFGRWYLSNKLSISFTFSNFVEYRFL